jgi:type II secretory pathway component PulC
MKITLQFSSLMELVSFQTAIKMRSYRINTSALSLTGSFSEAEVEFAKESYHVKVLQSEPTLQRASY